MLMLVLQSGWAAPPSHRHGPGKIRTHLVQTSVSCCVSYCNGSLKIHALLLGQDTSVCQAPGAAHWCRGVWFPGKVPSQGHESGSAQTAEAVATLIQGTLLSHWRAPPHTAAAVYSPADWHIQQWFILSPKYLPNNSPVASDVRNHTIVFFSILCCWVCLALCSTWQEMIH